MSSSNFNFKKEGYSTESVAKFVSKEEISDVLASPEITNRLEKFAFRAQKIAPKSDDFLYFTIIFLKSAEAALIDDHGNLRKVGHEHAWGYFDDNFKWHGNVPPHRNNNCFIAGTKILMEDGSVKNIEEIKAGDKVVSHDGTVKKVVITTKNKYSGELFKVGIRHNEYIYCTPEHPFYHIDLNKMGINKKGLNYFTKALKEDTVIPYKFSAIKNLKVGDILTSPNITDIKTFNDINPDRAYLLGMFAAEGSYSKKYNKIQGVKFTLGIHEEGIAKYIKELFSREFPECSLKINREPERSVISVTATGYNIGKYFHYHVGEYSHNKKLSKELVFSSNPETKKSFINGWIDGDGCMSDYNKVIGITTSPSLAYQIKTMLNSLNISASLRKNDNKKSIIVNKKYGSYKAKDHYRIEIPGYGSRELKLDKHSKRFEFNFKYEVQPENVFIDNKRLHTIRSIDKMDFDGFVYNFEVEDNHSYIANGIAVHNCDIFPEIELKKAARKWIGTPLCVDHKSDSVDGIRGIVLDTHYDEKLKQVVGLCAVDKVNYPDLARKVKTGVVRYGSMGTGVEISICSECQNKARTPQEYCAHIIQRSAYGEINVGLKPIEYSLVVQPAEPGAILLRTIASIKQHGQELKNFGVDDLDEFTGKLTPKQASDLDYLLHKTCGEEGCSLEQREQIVRGFLISNGFIRNADNEIDKIRKGTEALAELARAKEALNLDEKEAQEIAHRLLESIKDEKRMPQGETLTSGQYAGGSPTLITEDDQGVHDYTGTASTNLQNSDSGEIVDSFDTGGVGPESYLTRTASLKKNKSEIASIMEEIMKETKLRQRAEQRRKIAYHQGGAAPAVEPSTFKSEDYHKYWESDKHMHPNPANLGGDDGMVPGDKEVKEKQKRAKDLQNKQTKTAYHQGGAAPAVEPSTFKSEDYHKYWESDKHMHPNPSNLGGTDGMYPGDKEIKEQQKRAAYNGPRLSTKFKKRINLDGSINKAASCFEVYAGDKLVIAATAKDIMGPVLDQEWGWLTSKDYAKAVVAAIREEGLEAVGKMLTRKNAQDAGVPAMPPAPAPAPAPETGAMDMPAMEEMPEMDAPDLAEEAPMDEGMDESPKAVVDRALTEIEERVSELRSAVEKLNGDGGPDVINVNVGDESAEGEEIKLSRQILRDLKVALAEANESADELAKISKSLEIAHTLSPSVRGDLFRVSQAALKDSSELMGETSTLLKMAKTIANNMVKVSSYTEDVTPSRTRKAPARKAAASKEQDALIKAALDLRKQRRENLLKAAQKMDEEENCAHDEDVEMEQENEAHDGVGMKENAPVAGVAKDTTEDIARKQPTAPKEHGAAPSTGNQDAKQFSAYPSTPSRNLAEQSVTSVKQNAADDDEDLSDIHEVAEDEAKEEVDKHEERMHGKDNDALDEIKAKLQNSLIQKKAEEERQAYRIRVRRAYDLASEMQRKELIGNTRADLDHQVDLMLEFDDKAFESFKRSVAAVKAPMAKTASLEGISDLNVGVGDRGQVEEPVTGLSSQISRLWEGK